MRRISISTTIGIILGVAVIVWGVMSATNKWQIFFSLSSLQIVLGGTLTAAFIGYRSKYIWEACMYVFQSFTTYRIGPLTLRRDVGMIIEWAKRINKEGPAAYEKIMAENKKDGFINYIFSLASTGYSVDELRMLGETNIEEEYYRKLSGANILNSMASSAPAFGMVGTLIGLIVMLGEMEDPSKMGPGLSVALITTLYGVLFARFIFAPTSSKVRQNLGIRRFREFLLLEGIVLALQKKSTFYIQDRLNSFLDRRFQYSMSGSK
jgi:chemotaxis protein MotA